ncbi:MAG: hypothetical protein WCO35_03755 [Candidatus Nomurabacteria bacterium]
MKKYLLLKVFIVSLFIVTFFSYLNSFDSGTVSYKLFSVNNARAQTQYDYGVDTSGTQYNYGVDTSGTQYNYGVDTSGTQYNYGVDTSGTQYNYGVDTTPTYTDYTVDSTPTNTNTNYYDYSVTPYTDYTVDSTPTNPNSYYYDYSVTPYTTPYTPSIYVQPSYVVPVYTQPSYNYPTYQPQQQQQTYQCWNGLYVYNLSQCPSRQTQTCWDGSVIPVTQACPNRTQQTYQCWNGTYVYNLSQCPAQQQTQTCWDGSVIPVSQSCPPQYHYCPDGSILIDSQTCPVNTHTCWNGTVLPINQSCPVQTQVCSNGSIIPITQSCPAQYQTCWNGTTVPVNQSCPAQYQTCWNGTVIPVTQTCPVKNTTVIIKHVEIRDHSAETDLASRVTQTSAQCNGVGFISGGLSTIGWFEYGTSISLGKSTNSANIGSGEQESFSNVITNLKANTTYYCRAVIANTDGVYKGKIVSFKTLSASTKAVVYPTTKKSTKAKTKTQFVCSDGSLATAKTVAVADTVNAGGKLISINIERNNPDLVQGSLLNYRITLTSNSDVAITGTEAKVVLPTELSFVDATTTGGVTVKDGIMTVPIGNMNAKEAKTFILPVKVATDAEVGKAVMTTVYVSYNLPITGSQVVKDETSSYMVANIVSSTAVKTADTSKSGSSLAAFIFPQTLLGWLVLFAIVLVLVVLIMNIHKWIMDRKKEKEENAIHHHIA